MSLNENFKKKIEISRLVINPILDNLNEELINKKKEAYFTNAQCITSLNPLEFYFGFCFYNFFNVIFCYKNDSLIWTAYSCINKTSPINSDREYKTKGKGLVIEEAIIYKIDKNGNTIKIAVYDNDIKSWIRK